MKVGSLVLFSTDTGDVRLLDPEDHLAARLSREGDPEDVYFEEIRRIAEWGLIGPHLVRPPI